MPTLSSPNKLIATIYDTIIDPAEWPQILSSLSPHSGANFCALVLMPTLAEQGGAINALSQEVPDDLLREFSERFHDEGMELYPRLAAAPAGHAVSYESFYDNPEDYYSRPGVKFLEERLGVSSRTSMRLNDGKPWLDMIIAFHDKSRGLITAQEQQMLHQFQPHLAKAIEIGRGFTILRERYDTVLSVLDHYEVGLFMVTPNGQVIHRNRTANEQLDQKDGIYLTSEGTLSLEGVDASKQLQDAVHQIGMTINAEGAISDISLKAKRPSGHDSFLIEISPLRDVHGEIDPTFRGALIHVIDPKYQKNITTRGLQNLYDLTDAEAEVARLSALGHSDQEIADIRNVSTNTIFTQQKSLRAKTNTRSRTDLVRLALTINLPIRENEK